MHDSGRTEPTFPDVGPPASGNVGAGARGQSPRNPAFSVIIPTYNRPTWTQEAIEGALAQSLAPQEILVIDDGSTDDTATHLATFGPRIRILRQPNRGPAAAKNHGIAESTADWIAFLDSDDRWQPETLFIAAEAIAAHPSAGLVTFDAREVDAHGQPTGRVYGKRSPGAFYSTATLLRADSGGCSWFCARRDVLAATGGFDESLRSAEECDLCLRLSFVTRLVGTRRPLVLRRRHPDNLSSDVAQNARGWLRALEKLRADHPDFVARHPRIFRRALGKERLRLGRARLLACSGDDASALAEARHELRACLAAYPSFLRAWLYLACAWTAPRAYAAWRKRELRWRGLAD